MTTTRSTLLKRLKNRSDAEAWREFHKLYAPLLYRYARGRGLSREDAEDVRDQCLEAVARKIGTFENDKKKGGFKSWLYRIASGKVIDLLRKRREKVADTQDIRGLVDPAPSADEVWEEHWRHGHLRCCVEQVRGSVSERNFKVFDMLLFDDCSPKGATHDPLRGARQSFPEAARLGGCAACQTNTDAPSRGRGAGLAACVYGYPPPAINRR